MPADSPSKSAAASVLMSFGSAATDTADMPADNIGSPGGVQTPYSEEEKCYIIQAVVDEMNKPGAKGKSDAAINKAAAAALNEAGSIPSRTVRPLVFSFAIIITNNEYVR